MTTAELKRQGAERLADTSQAGAPGDHSTRVSIRDIPAEVEEYSSAVAGIEIEAIRIGPAVRRSHVVAVAGGRFTFTSSKIGFPMLSRATVPDDSVVIAGITGAVPGSRWCEIPLEPGQVIAYSPAAEHIARNLPGVTFNFVCCELRHLQNHAEQLGTNIDVPPRGEVHLLADGPSTALVGPAFARFAERAERGEQPNGRNGDDVLRAVVHALSSPERPRRIGADRHIDARRVVLAGIELAEALGRIPSISELCAVSHLSERRLRQAFTEEFGTPPTRFFRAWALGEAHRRLAHGDPARATVTEVAADLGFGHLGRFSGHYRQIFDECPSQTLLRAGSTPPKVNVRHGSRQVAVPDGLTGAPACQRAAAGARSVADGDSS